MENLKRFNGDGGDDVVMLFKFNMATFNVYICFFLSLVFVSTRSKNYMNHMKIDFKPNILKVKWFTVYIVCVSSAHWAPSQYLTTTTKNERNTDTHRVHIYTYTATRESWVAELQSDLRKTAYSWREKENKLNKNQTKNAIHSRILMFSFDERNKGQLTVVFSLDLTWHYSSRIVCCVVLCCVWFWNLKISVLLYHSLIWFILIGMVWFRFPSTTISFVVENIKRLLSSWI